MNQKKSIVLIFSVLFMIIMIPNSYAFLESDTQYILEGEQISIIIDTSDDKVLIDDGWVIINNETEFFDVENLKFQRSYEDGNYSRFLGTTDKGNPFYAKYVIEDDNVKLFVKVWHDGIKTRILEDGTISYLFK